MSNRIAPPVNLVLGLALVLVVGMGGLGLAYAAYTDQITIGGTVSTGTLKAEWRGTGSRVFSHSTSTTCTATINTSNFKQIDLGLSNAYPGAECVVQADVLNTGTLPIVGFAFTQTGHDAANLEWDVSGPGCTITPPDLAAATSKSCQVKVKVKASAPQASSFSAALQLNFTGP